MSYRSSSPVSGFAGHVPGNKWQVGSKSFNTFPNNIQQLRSQDPEPTVISDHSHTFDFEGNPIPRFASPYFFPQMTPAEYTQFYNQQMANFQSNGSTTSMMPQQQQQFPVYGFNPALSMNNGFQQNGGGMASSASMQGINNQSQISPNNANGNSRNDQAGNDQQKARSKSMPRKPKSEVRDMFGGIESGWWSEGQALKNIRRHQQNVADASGASSNVNGTDQTTSSSSTSRYRRRAGADRDDDDVPTPGYSGHVPGMKTHGIGKPFTVAAKECRRIMHANENAAIEEKAKKSAEKKDEHQQQNQNQQFSRQQQQQPYPPSMAVNGFPQQQQQFMNSYPYMTPNGMMQPMYMGLPQQQQNQQNPQNNINQSEY